MTDRRTFLAASVGVVLAGCLSDPTGNGDENGDEDENGSGNENEDEAENDLDEEFDVSEYAPSLAAGDLPREAHSVAVHFRSEDEAEEALDTEALTDDARDEVEEFVDETEFEEATLFYVQTRAPNACYELQVEELELEEETVTGTLVAEDVSEPDEACAQVVITPAALFRAHGEDEPPEEAELEVTDGWEETETVTSVPPEEYDPKEKEDA